MPQTRHIGLTLVSYSEGDVLGCFLAWISLVPVALAVSEGTAILLAESKARLCDAILMFTGQILNELINLVLKNIMKVPRPIGEIDFKEFKK